MNSFSIKILEKDSKAIALINYLKTLDFVEVVEEKDWWDDLGIENKASIDRGLDDLNNSNIHKDQDVRNAIKKRILNAETK
ncbi:hypothetical protein [Brumimicrobium oceani]|uniref:Uncharacterized protein n=1 Tax=Brumimicrobium oceani TaxID=2100725 RepID=A0A2U2XHA0_9FLAO|nr:hypothetical protein [Brumimicrobium oceani]PWH87165.1 hypothetical protein DIT68_02570 [Brumimicrobium oceani]